MGRERTVMLMRRSEARDQSAIRALVREAGINPLHLHWRNFVVVETGERVIACGQLRPHRDGSVELASLAVSPSYQGLGIGRAIVRTLLHLAPPDVYLMCDAKLRGFYEAFGFLRVGLGDLPREMRGLYRIGLLLTWAIRTLTRQPVGVIAMRRTAETVMEKTAPATAHDRDARRLATVQGSSTIQVIAIPPEHAHTLRKEHTMQYGTVPGIDKPISRLVQGSMMIASDRMEQSFALLDAIYGMGGNTFDTAHVYGGGDVERTFGRWVRERGLRDEIVVIGKGAHHNQDRQRVTPFDITADIYDSLARFQFDYMDLYLLHRDDPSQPVGPIVEALNEHKRAGRIHAFGGSNWSAERVQAANAYAAEHGLEGFSASSPNFSLAVQVEEPWPNCVSIGGPLGQGDRAWYEETHLPLFTWSSLAGGFFSGRFSREHTGNPDDYFDKLVMRCYAVEENYQRLDRVQAVAEAKGMTIPQVAMAYVMNAPMNIFALIGTRTPDEFADNVAASEVKLTPEEMAWLELRTDERPTGL